MAFFDWLSTTALSFIFSGNTGVSPFLSLFLIGIIERTSPDLLSMDGTIEWILSSWFTIILWGILMVVEFVAKCIPVLDEVRNGRSEDWALPDRHRLSFGSLACF